MSLRKAVFVWILLGISVNPLIAQSIGNDLVFDEALYALYHRRADASLAINLPDDKTSGTTLTVSLMRQRWSTPLETKTFEAPYRQPLRVSFDLTQREKGNYFMKAELRRKGDLLTSAVSRMFPYNPSPKVGFDKNGFLLVDGKPFFPIGIYTLQNRDGGNHDPIMAEAKRAGFNTTVFYAYTPETIAPLLEAAARNGILAFVYPTIPFSIEGGKNRSDQAVIRDVEIRRDSAALLGWYIVDEPEGIGKANEHEVRERYQIIKETDQDHPCSLVIMSPQAAAKYRSCTDVMWIDPYPIPHAPVTYVSDCVSGAVKAVEKDKPVWCIPQAFDWNVWKTGKVNQVHRPTPEEERCMTYLALVHGAKGIIYWAHTASRYYIRDYPDHWEAVKKLAGEMNLLTPALLTPSVEGRLTVTPHDAPVDTMVKVHGGSTYVFVVNHSNESREVVFRLKGLTDGKRITVMFEGRDLYSESDTWKDLFKPLEVHVYRIGGSA